MAKKVLVIGWDAADWKIIRPLIDAGEMPTLQKFLSEGTYGNISTMDPPLSPILWTSIATGKLPEQHGILNFIEPDNVNGGIKPVSALSRKSKAIWNILNQQGHKSNVIGWWPSNPAEPINGIMVSNLFQKSDKTPDDPWPMKSGTVHPVELEDTFANMRIHPGELTEQHILPFVPNAFNATDKNDNHLAVLSTMLAETASVHAAVTWAMENKPADFTAVYYDGIDHFCHAFMKYHPPRISDALPDYLFNLYKDVVKAAYKFHDMMLERLLQLTDEDTTVMIVSDHGFHSDHMRPLKIPNEPAGPIYEHREYGIFCMKGPGIKKNHQLFGTTLLDITPTLLMLYGLPIGKDMAGKPLLAAFENSVTPEYIESWENVQEGDAGMHPSDKLEDPIEAHAALRQLVELGYIEDPGEDKNKASENCIKESQYYLGRSLLFTNSYEKALPIFESLFTTYGDIRFAAHYLHCLLQVNSISHCRSVMDKLIVKHTTLPPSIRYHEACLLIKEKKLSSAIEVLKDIAAKHHNIVGVNIQLGNVYLTLDKLNEAIESFTKALGYNTENPNAYFGLGLAFARQNKHEEASENLLRSIELVFYNPSAHYYLGESQVQLGEKEYAIQAFENTIALSPGMSKARHWLVKLYNEIGNTSMAEKHNAFIENNIQRPVVIVSGLPRSGTSMMMQMLHDGGADILTDFNRKPDDNNPKGYFEYEPVKKLAENADWLLEQSGKTVKIIAQLLPHIPVTQKYKVIFMEREMGEVLKSQQIMISGNASTVQSKAYPLGLADIFDKQLSKIGTWLDKQPNIEVLYLHYSEVVENPSLAAKRVEEFLGLNLNIEEMTKAVDKNLYRNQNPVWK